MMILAIEILGIIIFVVILSTLIMDEKRNRDHAMSTVKLQGYWDGIERRTADRLNINLDVKYTPNGRAQKTKSMDISARGIRLLLTERLDKGTLLRMEIRLPSGEHVIRASGEVVWTEESKEEALSSKRLFNTGIKFFKFYPGDEKKLFDFIFSNQP